MSEWEMFNSPITLQSCYKDMMLSQFTLEIVAQKCCNINVYYMKKIIFAWKVNSSSFCVYFMLDLFDEMIWECVWLYYPYRCWRQQPELNLLRAPDALAAAQPVWGPDAGPLGECGAGRLLHHGLRLPQRPGPCGGDGQWTGHIPAPWPRVQGWVVTWCHLKIILDAVNQCLF